MVDALVAARGWRAPGRRRPTRATSSDVDQVATDLDLVAHLRSASARTSGRAGPLAPDLSRLVEVTPRQPEVPGDQHARARPRAIAPSSGSATRRVRVGAQGRERRSAHLGQGARRAVSRSVEEDGTSKACGDPARGRVTQKSPRRRSLAPRATKGTTSTTPKRGCTPSWPRRSSRLKAALDQVCARRVTSGSGRVDQREDARL